MCRCPLYPRLFLWPPVLGLRLFRWVALLRPSLGGFCAFSVGRLARSFFSCLWGVVVASSLSLSSLSPLSCVRWGAPVVVLSVGRWVPCPVRGGGSFSVVLSSGLRPSVRVPASAVASGAASRLAASLRAARDSGVPVSLGVRSGWSPARWFCAVAPASSRALAA